MYRISFLIEKEFRQIFRNKILLRIMLISPLLQLLLLSYAANYEVKDILMAVVDQDHTPASMRLIHKFAHSPNFLMQSPLPAYKKANEALQNGDVDMVIIIPRGFDKHLKTQRKPTVQLMVSAIDATKAGIANGYAQTIIQAFQQEEQPQLEPMPSQASIAVHQRYWFNPYLEYKTFMVPGILFELMILIGGIIAALNIVREKEIGTQEQLNVTPIRKGEFIVGKLTPFVILGLVQFSLSLCLAIFVFRIPVLGSIGTLYLFAILFMILCVGLGLLVSAISSTQQQAVFVIFFCLMIFILLSGLFSSTEHMPMWAKALNSINPLKYVIFAGRNILLKGSTLADLNSQLWALASIAISLLLLAYWRFQKTV